MALASGQTRDERRLGCFGLTTADGAKLAAFYETAAGFRVAPGERKRGAAFERLMDVEGGATSTTLALGVHTIELLQFDQPGSPYPGGVGADDLVFQHFAIVVSDMAAAYQRLLSVADWTPITVGGPQQLPKSAGGVVAFKFRDPEGHPLEFLSFAKDATPSAWRSTNKSRNFQGIDHSAISVSDTAASIAFFGALGFHVGSRTLNSGPEQARLDAVQGVMTNVVSLLLTEATPHLELLGYQHESRRPPLRLRSNDIAATRLVVQRATAGQPLNARARRVDDPDGHHIILLD